MIKRGMLHIQYIIIFMINMKDNVGFGYAFWDTN